MKATTAAFKENVRAALDDTQLQRALAGLPTGLVANRAAARARLPEFEDLREVGRDIKDHTLAYLDVYLEQWEAKAKAADVVTCDACPVLCRIRPGKTGACDRYGNVDGALVRMDPFVVTQRAVAQDGKLVPFLGQPWDGAMLSGATTFVTGIGAGTTYPDYKPAPFIVSSAIEGVEYSALT